MREEDVRCEDFFDRTKKLDNFVRKANIFHWSTNGYFNNFIGYSLQTLSQLDDFFGIATSTVVQQLRC